VRESQHWIKARRRRRAMVAVLAIALILVGCGGGTTTISRSGPPGTTVTFPQGTATPSEVCGQCHVGIYAEVAFGTGADLKFGPIILKSLSDPLLSIPGPFFDTASAHHLAGVDPWPISARDLENGGAHCNTCHYPEPFNLPDLLLDQVIHEPTPRPVDEQDVGMTCASCHLTPDGKIRGKYDPSELLAPHENVRDSNFPTSVMCAFCHSKGPRVVGKQTQTYYEWRDDYFAAGLGQKQCEDCHMPQEVRVLAEDWGTPPRAVGQHIWPGSHSATFIRQGLTLSLQKVPNTSGTFGAAIQVHVHNVGAGHSVPSGSNRRGIWMDAAVIDGNGNTIAANEWLFAPWFSNRPDDRTFITEDQTLPFPDPQVAQTQADVQGPHETPVRAGEDRVLTWTPALPMGSFTVRVVLTYDLNRYNDRSFTQDQTELARSSISIQVP